MTTKTRINISAAYQHIVLRQFAHSTVMTVLKGKLDRDAIANLPPVDYASPDWQSQSARRERAYARKWDQRSELADIVFYDRSVDEVIELLCEMQVTQGIGDLMCVERGFGDGVGLYSTVQIAVDTSDEVQMYSWETQVGGSLHLRFFAPLNIYVEQKA